MICTWDHTHLLYCNCNLHFVAEGRPPCDEAKTLGVWGRFRVFFSLWANVSELRRKRIRVNYEPLGSPIKLPLSARILFTVPGHPILSVDQSLLFLDLGVGGVCWSAIFMWWLLSPAVHPPLPHDPCEVREPPQTGRLKPCLPP